MLWKPLTKAKSGGEKNHNFMLARDFLKPFKRRRSSVFSLKKKKTVRQPLPFTYYVENCKVL